MYRFECCLTLICITINDGVLLSCFSCYTEKIKVIAPAAQARTNSISVSISKLISQPIHQTKTNLSSKYRKSYSAQFK